jgi:hypothetical protein
MSPGDARGAPTVAQQGVIRLALLVGVILFGAVIWWLARDGRVPLRAGEGGAAPLGVMRVLAAALAVGAVGAATLLRSMIARTTDPARIAQLRIVAWSLAEMPALLGGVYWLLSGDASRYTIGLVALVATFVIVPLRAR